MFLFMILFFIIYVISLVVLIYNLKLQDDDLETLYDNYSKYIEESFNRGVKNGWYVFKCF